MGKITDEQKSEYSKRLLEDLNKADRIIAGELPAQETPGIMTPAERRASIAKAFGAKPKQVKVSDEEKSYKSGGSVSSASKRADGCAVKGKTKGRIV